MITHRLSISDRISGGTGAINAIRNAYNEGTSVLPYSTDISFNVGTYLGSFPDFESDERFADIHAVCGAVKLFLRQLPEPVVPFHLYHEAIESSRALLARRHERLLSFYVNRGCRLR